MPSAIKPPEASLVATDTGHRASYDGTGYALLLGPYAVLVLGLLCWFGYGLWVDPASRSAGVVFLAVGLSTPSILLLVYAARMFTRSVDFTSTHITTATLFGATTIQCADVASVTFSPRNGAVILHTKSGVAIQLPLLNGCEADLEQCVRRYLPGIESS